MKDVARMAGVSQPTVSRFLNGETENFSIAPETRNRILGAIKQLGYIRNEAARELKGQKTNLRVMFCNIFDSPLIYHGIRERLQTMEGMQNVSFFFHHIQEERLLNDPTYFLNIGLSTYRTCIIMGTSLKGDEWFRENLSQLPIPILFIGRLIEGFPSITIDYKMQMVSTLNYLWERGCRRILYFGRQWISQVDQARIAAYHEFCKRRQIPKLMLNHGSFDEHGGYMLMHEALSQNMKPDSIICINDAQGIGAIRALHDAGVTVPKQIRVIGYGNFPICRYTLPSLTSVPQFTHEILDAVCGYIAGAVLHGEEPSPPYQKVFVSHEIICRESG